MVAALPSKELIIYLNNIGFWMSVANSMAFVHLIRNAFRCSLLPSYGLMNLSKALISISRIFDLALVVLEDGDGCRGALPLDSTDSSDLS